MALAPRFRAVDRELYFSKAVSLTVTTATYSSEIDFGSVDMGLTPVQVVVQVSSISATAASTFNIEVAAGTATTPTTIVQDIGTVVTGSANFEKIFSLPADVARYVRLRYTLAGSAASSASITSFATQMIG